MARAVLASDWLAAHDAEVAARALRGVEETLRAEAVDAHDPLRQRGRDLWGLTVARRIVKTARADALAASQGAGESGEGER
jgi:hypothetical protein